jgi:hypothetical protein
VDRSLSNGQRVQLAFMALAAGNKGVTWSGAEYIAQTLGLSVDYVKESRKPLRERGYIQSVRRGQGRTALTRFPWHPQFRSEVGSAPLLEVEAGPGEVGDAPSGTTFTTTSSSGPGPTSLEAEKNWEKNHEKLQLQLAAEAPRVESPETPVVTADVGPSTPPDLTPIQKALSATTRAGQHGFVGGFESRLVFNCARRLVPDVTPAEVEDFITDAFRARGRATWEKPGVFYCRAGVLYTGVSRHNPIGIADWLPQRRTLACAFEAQQNREQVSRQTEQLNLGEHPEDCPLCCGTGVVTWDDRTTFPNGHSQVETLASWCPYCPAGTEFQQTKGESYRERFATRVL